MESRATGAKKKDIGILGILLVVGNAASHYHTETTITDKIEDLSDKLNQVKLTNEQYFVKKTELQTVVTKLDKLNDRIIKIDQTLRDYGYRVESSNAISCKNEIRTSLNDY